MEKLKKRQRLGWLFSLAWMGVIFLFSAQDATESAASSSFVMDILCQLFHLDDTLTSGMDLDEGMGIFLLRKGAHFFVFTVLGTLLTVTVCQYPAATTLQKISIPMSLGILYACIDELHQYFVPGRACQIRDVCIDTCGVLCGILLALGLFRLLEKRRRKRKQHDST